MFSVFSLKIDFRVRKSIPELFFCSRRIDNYIGGMFVALTLYRVTIRSPLLQQRAVWPFCPCAASIFSMSSEANTSHPHHTVDSRFSKYHFFTAKIVLCTFYCKIVWEMLSKHRFFLRKDHLDPVQTPQNFLGAFGAGFLPNYPHPALYRS